METKKPKSGDRREDGGVWYRSRWLTENEWVLAKERHRLNVARWRANNKQREDESRRRLQEEIRNDPERHQRQKNRQNAWAKKNRVKRTKAHADYRRRNSARLRKYAAERRARLRERINNQSNANYAKRTPTYGLQRTLSEYRRGRIGFDEVIRRCEDACARADELCREIESKSGSTPSDLERPSKCGQGNSGTGQGQG